MGPVQASQILFHVRLNYQGTLHVCVCANAPLLAVSRRDVVRSLGSTRAPSEPYLPTAALCAEVVSPILHLVGRLSSALAFCGRLCSERGGRRGGARPRTADAMDL